ncbi:MAG: helix-turn-helix transcriptional regulator [Alicyclobacillus sp.]|nr:helix-turn-helix transcriptional regulator [Alicyclobacillus sp.]
MTERNVIALRYLWNDDVPAFYQIGWELHVGDEPYDWDCRLRTDPHCLFAYTVSGCGEVEIDGVCTAMDPGWAFLIEIPGPYRYHIPPHSHHWELKYICLNVECLPVWSRLVERIGRVVSISGNTQVMQVYDHLFELARQNLIDDVYLNSALTYRFLMELYRLSRRDTSDIYPHPVRICKEYIDQHIQDPITLDHLAELAQVTKYHLTRLFRHHLHETPIQYVLKTRVKQAAELLIETEYSISEISRMTGFSNPNYFAKVFRKFMGQAPREFRRYAEEQRIRHIHVR